jgi:hypothetical protein
MLFKCRLERQVGKVYSTITIEVKAKSEYEAAQIAEKAMGNPWHFMAIVKKK